MPANPSPSKVERLDVGDINEEVQKAINSMDEIQNNLDQLTEKASVEILVVEQKYNKLRRPHYQKRNEIIATLPAFWSTVFSNHPQVSSILTENDEIALTYCNEMEVEEFEDIKSGYKVSFRFKENPYFTNDLLVKEFHISDEMAEDDAPASKHTEIKWKPGKSLVPKQPELKTGAKRSKEEMGGPASFFAWFNETSEDGICEIGESLKDDIWPNPLQYYLNDVNDSVEDEEFEEEEEEDFGDAIEEEGSEEEEEEEEDGA
jgi:template-activating factor I